MDSFWEVLTLTHKTTKFRPVAQILDLFVPIYFDFIKSY